MNTKTLLATVLAATAAWCQPEVVVAGLQTPHKMILTAGGNLLVSEPSMTANAGRVSYVTRGGTRRSLFEGLPSGIEVTLAGGSGPNAMALRERTLYLAIGLGDSERRAAAPRLTHNPEGVASPLFGTIIEIRFSQDVDTIGGTFRLTPQQHFPLHDGEEIELSDGSGATATLSVLTRFPIAEPAAGTIYRFSNPWGLALTEDGRGLYVSDASVNSVARVDTSTGRWRRLVRFPPYPNPTPVGPPILDSVPTSVRVYGDQLLVSFLSGFPFVPGNARVLAVNPDAATIEPFIFGLTSVTDVLWRTRSDGQSEFYVTEFSQNQGATLPPPGRLLRFDSSGRHVVIPVLITPVSLAYDESTRDLFILELRGQVQRLRLD
jgi:hypothetical protein